VNGQQQYLERINQAIDWISANLDGRLSLQRVAAVAHFSPFHFHRIFRTLTGESVLEFVTRLRLERALFLMRSARGKSLTEVAAACGLGSPSSFTRTFRKHFGIAPSAADLDALLEERKIGQDAPEGMHYFMKPFPLEQAPPGMRVRIERFGPLKLAYVRVVGAYLKPDELKAALGRLEDWAERTGIDRQRSLLIGMSMDDPEIVPLEKCRYDFCRTVERAPGPRQGISFTTLRACDWAICHIKGDLALFDRAYNYLFKHWLPQSGYQPAPLPGMEIYRAHPHDVGWETFDIDACIPIMPLA
jgi:AraC family transcriptional regulator